MIGFLGSFLVGTMVKVVPAERLTEMASRFSVIPARAEELKVVDPHLQKIHSANYHRVTMHLPSRKQLCLDLVAVGHRFDTQRQRGDIEREGVQRAPREGISMNPVLFSGAMVGGSARATFAAETEGKKTHPVSPQIHFSCMLLNLHKLHCNY